MSDYKEKLNYWLTSPLFDEETKSELRAIQDEKELEDRFYKDLEFGTGGARGIMGAGTNRFNKYNVRIITAGFSKHLLKIDEKLAKEKGVAIAYDSRNHSKEFAKEAALVFAAYGIPVHLFNIISATPLLSFTVRYLGCAGGLVVTASHNTKEYNGYKAYDKTGCQLYPTDADDVIAEVSKVRLEDAMSISEEAAISSGLLDYIGEELLRAYMDTVKKESHDLKESEKANLKIVYTPLHGAGNVPVRTVLSELGFTDVNVVKEQEAPDGNFPTVVSPNPGEISALKMAVDLAESIGADIVVASDPDSDRIGMASKGSDGKFVYYSGNQICALLIDYVLTRRKDRLTEKSTLITTVVTSEFGSEIARRFGLHIETTLTGFKFIGERETRLHESGKYHCEFGYEESNGCMIGDYNREKDSVSAIMLMCEMAAYNKARGLSVYDKLQALYKDYGFYLDHLDSFVFTGKDGAEKIKAINAKLRTMGKSLDADITDIKDYAPGIDNLPPSDVLKYWYKDGSWMAIRPSGTEPKIKVYYCIHNDDKESANQSLKKIQRSLQNVIDSIE